MTAAEIEQAAERSIDALRDEVAALRIERDELRRQLTATQADLTRVLPLWHRERERIRLETVREHDGQH